MMKRLRTIFAMLLLVAAIQAAGQDIIIEPVCVGATRQYRVEGEQASVYTWELYNTSDLKIQLPNNVSNSGRSFTQTDPDGDIHYMNEIIIQWNIVGVYKLKVIQEAFGSGCDIIDHGFIEVFEQPTVMAGNPLSICADEKIYLTSSTANNQSSLLWSSSGDGTFDDPTALRTAYNSGPNDRITGSVELTLTAYGKGVSTSCEPVSSTLTSTFLIIPKLVVNDPAPVCAPATIDLSLPAVTLGSDSDVGSFEYFADEMATIPLVNFKAVDRAGTYYIRGTNSTNCSVIQPVNVTFTPLRDPNFSSIPDVCLNSIQQLPASNFNGISGHWEPSATINATTEGEFTYTFKVDPNQCASDYTVKIKVTNSITPTFAFKTTYCLDEIADPLPTISGNGLSGTWDKPLSTSSIGEETYTFTPDANSCGASLQIKITVNQPASPPTFDFLKELCLGSAPFVLPTRSVEGVNGTWDIPVVSTSQLGPTNYTFTPSAGQCVQYRVESIRIIEKTTPTFNRIGPFCFGSSPQALPTTSTNEISGTWSPSAIATNKSGIITYRFTPNATFCAEALAIPIEIYEPITVTATFDPITVLGGTTTVTVSASGGSGTFTGGTGQIVLGSGNHDITVTDNAGCKDTKTIYISEPQQFDVEAKILTASPCFGGNAQIQAIASGGTAPYSYRVFRGNQLFLTGTLNQNTFYVPASALPYHFEVVDAENKFARSNILEVTDPPKIELTASATETSCAGMADGTATVEPKFGQAPYFYKWDNGQTTATATGLSAGTHRVTVWDQLDCYRVPIDVVVSDPSVKTIQAFATDPKCHGEAGTIRFTFTNVPDGIYNILYDGDQFSNVQVTNFTASVQAMPGNYNNLKLIINGCSTANGVNATVNQTPAITFNLANNSPTHPSCTNNSGTIVVSALGSGYQYSKDDGLNFQGSNTFSFLPSGPYKLRVKQMSTGCISEPLEVVINPVLNAPPAPVIASTTNPDCTTSTGSVTLNGLPATGTWTLTRTPGNIKTPGTGTSFTISGLSAGTYTYTVTGGITTCTSAASANVVIDAQPVTEAPIVGQITQPNCTTANGSVELSGLPASGTWTVSASPGGAIITGTGSTATFPGLNSGTYTFTVTNGTTTCTSVASASVIIDLQPITPQAPIAGTPTVPDCETPDGSVELSGLPSGIWTITSEEGTINGTGANTTVTGLTAASTYNFTVTNADGCTSAATIVKIAPQVSIPADLATIVLLPECEENPAQTLDARKGIVAPPAGTNIRWYDQAGNLVASPVLNSPGSVTYYAEAFIGNCVSINRSAVTLTMNATPAAPVSKGDISACAGRVAVTLDARNAISGAVTNIKWYDRAIGGNVVALPTLSTVGSRTYYAEASNGTCVSETRTPVTLSIYALPVKPVVIVTQKPTCDDENGTIQVTSPAAGTGFEYSLNGGTYQPSPVFENLKTNDYYIRVRNLNTLCESDTAKRNVPAIPPAPALSVVSVEQPKCYGDPFTINLSMTTTIPSGNYTFFYDGGTFENIAIANNKATITGTITESSKDFSNLRFIANGCTSTGDPDVRIVSPAELEIRIVKVMEQSLKGIQKGAIDIVASGGSGTYKYSWSNGETSQDLNDVPFGDYTVTVTDDNDCDKPLKIRVPLNNPPVALADTVSFSCLSVSDDLLKNDYDPDPIEQEDFITVNTAAVTMPSFAQEFRINADGTFDYKALPGYTGADFFEYEIVDKLGQTARARVSLNVVSDIDGDGIADADDPDADGDGILNIYEALTGQDWRKADADGDGLPNYLDIDSDNDGIVDNVEAQPVSPNYIQPSNLDVNNNGVDDAYDTFQLVPEIKRIDTDNDGIPDFMDADSDNDGVPDYIEGHDGDSNGKPDYYALGKDSDFDGLDDAYDTVVNECNILGNAIGSNAVIQDTDSDGLRDWRDDNDDDDLYLTKYEDLNADGDFSNDDVDFDGTPEYLDFGRDCDLFIPDIFTPNADNIHDYFQIYCINHYPDAKMYIFDQAGNKIFEKKNYGNLDIHQTAERAYWDGRPQIGTGRTSNERVAVGTYYYVLDLGNGEVKKSFVFVSY
ncbi:MAG: hypothetical protein A2066_06070 [Bacteroidetes bacterium GWB2_41_8]|nr:MAG: hypothetical protein A2066_06070 [Bacteroidetes bacterium GWB2_41_8]